VFFLGVFLTGFSSSYYHWNPNDAGLFWDRLPMSIAFMAILSNVVEERIDAKVGKALLWPLVALGIVSLLVAADRRPAALRLGAVLPVSRAAADLLAVRAEVQRHLVLVCRRGLVLLAKVLEYADADLFGGHIMAGHALKHVAAAAALLSAILRAFQTRQPVRAC
jgi:hypothetical protein